MHSVDSMDAHEDSSTESATILTTSPALNANLLEMPTIKSFSSREIPNAVVPVVAGQGDDGAHCEKTNIPATTSASASRATYCSTGVQTMPAASAEEFRKIHDREPTQDELLKKIGCAGIGRYGPGPRPYEVIIGRPFSMEPCQGVYDSQEAAFQTSEVAHVKKSLVRSKVKATILAKRQLKAAKDAGYNIWPETNEDIIVHREQHYIDIQLDDEGNATNVDVRGLSLPNICGEEINPTSLPLDQHQPDRINTGKGKGCIGRSIDSKPNTSSSVSEASLSPLLASEDDAVREPPRLQPISTIALFAPGVDPASIEDYGYLTLAPKTDKKEEPSKDTKTHNPQDSQATAELSEDENMVIVVGGERFADYFIVHDATGPRPVTPTGPRKRRNNDREDIGRTQGAYKRPKTTNADEVVSPQYLSKERTRQYDEVSINLHASRRGITERDATSHALTKNGSSHGNSSGSVQEGHEDERAPDDCSRHSSRMQKSQRDRSRSPGDRHGSGRYRTRSRGRHTSVKPVVEERRHPRTSEVDQERLIPRAPASMRAADKMHVVSTPERKTRKTADPSAHKVQQDRNGTTTQRQAAISAVQELNIAKRNAQLEKEQAASRAREAEDRHRQEEEMIKEAKQLQKKRQLEEAEIKRARDAKNRRKLEIEEEKRTQEAERRRQQEEQDRQHHREQERAANLRNDRWAGRHEHAMSSSSTPVDEYALAREAENQRRELASGLAPVGTGRRNARERSPRHAKKEAERRAPEKKVEDNKVTKPRPERNARGELERYDPRKRFGGGR